MKNRSFFVETSTLPAVTGYLNQARVSFQSTELTLETFAHHGVTGLYFNSIDEAYRGQDVLKAQGVVVYEADVRLHDRYLTERFVHGPLEFTGVPTQCDGYLEYRQVRIRSAKFSPCFTVLSLDIECSVDGDLYSIGLHGSEVSEVLMIGEPESDSSGIQWVANEKALLQALVKAVKVYDPDIFIGWNVINFDFRLLLERARHHQIKLTLGRGNQPASWRERRGEPGQGFITIPGRMVIDGIDSLKAATYQFDSFSLENVARELLGRGKDTDDVENRLAAITRDFHHNKQKLARYNLEDCRLVTDIFEKTRLLDFLRLRSELTGLELDRMGGSVQAFTNLYMPRLHRAGYVSPNLPDDGGLASPGGYVMDSFPGLYKNVLVLDFKSLYPSIIRTFKIDPLGLIEGLKDPEQAIPGYREALFSREKHFLPEIITSLWQQRDEAKKEKDSARSQALKILMNSFYGVLGSGGCRFYDTRLASSITLRGHDIMKQTARWIEGEGHKVIYGDTDSTFILLDEHLNHDQADQIGMGLATDINKRWKAKLEDEFNLKCHLELEYETHYSRFLMPTIRGSEVGSKKRYAGIIKSTQGEELIFKGLETVRSDWTKLAKNFQIKLYELVFSDQSPKQLIQETVKQTLAGERDAELVYRKRLRRPLSHYVKNIPPQVRAARQADERNKANNQPLKYQRRGWVSYLITVNGPETIEYRESLIDYQHYIDKQLKPVADAILPFIGQDFDRLIDEQLGLF